MLCFIISRSVKMQLKCIKKVWIAYGEGAGTEQTCWKRFVKFRAGDFSLDNAPRSGRPVEVDSDQIETWIGNNQRSTMWELADILQISNSIKLLGKWKLCLLFYGKKHVDFLATLIPPGLEDSDLPLVEAQGIAGSFQKAACWYGLAGHHYHTVTSVSDATHSFRPSFSHCPVRTALRSHSHTHRGHKGCGFVQPTGARQVSNGTQRW